MNGNQLVFPDFKDIKVSTKTFIVMTNIKLNLTALFDFLPVTDYNVLPKRRGRKKKHDTDNIDNITPSGSIITMKYDDRIKGVDLKQKKKDDAKEKKCFRNSFTVVIFVNDKMVNLKVCRNGVLQVTGCKSVYQVEGAVKHLWNYIKDQKGSIYTFNTSYIPNITKPDYSDIEDISDFELENEDDPDIIIGKPIFEMLIIPAMRNIDFKLGFNVDRERLANYISTQTDFHSLLETSFGYTGVNIKFPLSKDICEMKIKKVYCDIDSNWDSQLVPYTEYLNKLTNKEKDKKLRKKRYNTFLVFHSGKVIMSTACSEFGKDCYYYFLDIIRRAYEHIEERLD